MILKRTLVTATLSLGLLLAVPSFAQIKMIDEQTEQSVEIAQGFYFDVIKYRNLNNFSRYVGETYLQHAPAYGDGPAQLISAVALELTNDPGVKVEILRTIAEGPYVAIHSAWTATSGDVYVYIDIWRTEKGTLVEHWDHYQKVPTESANKNTMYQGPDADIYSRQNKEQNRERSLALLASFNNPSNVSAVDNFVAEQYIQHNPMLQMVRKRLLII